MFRNLDPFFESVWLTNMRIAYLTNRYPAASHSFISREIVALEELGLEVSRISIRCAEDDVVDKQDQEELKRTKVILTQPKLLLAAKAILEACGNPPGFFRALGMALRLGRGSIRGFVWHGFYLIEALVMTRWIRRAGVEHIHAHFGTNSTTVAMLANAFSKTPYSFTVHGPDEFDRPVEIHLAEKIQRSKFVVAVSSYGRSQLMRWVDMDHWDKINVVHCGIDHSFAEEPEIEASTAARLVCISRLAPQKGLPLLVEACAILKLRSIDFEMVLAGDGPLRAQIEAQIKHLGLGNEVRITGWITSDEVKQEVSAARALVLASFAEGLPVVIMEAMAMARPVVATYIAGIPELVLPNVTGLLVPAGNVAALADAMQTVLKMPMSDLEKFGAKSRIRVLERHDISTEVLKLHDLFKSGSA